MTVTLADERWINADDPSSNERLVRENLLCGAAAAANFVPLKNASATPFDGVEDVEQAIDAIAKPFDAVILGMGDDGHTASLFPGATNLSAALDMSSHRLYFWHDPANCSS